jgi:hypothetical protein
MKISLQKSLSKRKVLMFGVIGAVLFCSLIVFFVLSPSISRPQTAPVSRSQTAQVVTPPDGKIKQFYNDLLANNYSDAYLLFSTNVRQQFGERGGATYLQQLMQSYIQQYGNIITYAIEKQTTEPGTNQIVVTVQIHRSKFQAQQSEKDTLTLISEANVWVIDKWGSNVTTNPA